MADQISQKEQIARLYLQKAESLARAVAEREGQPYGTTNVDMTKVAEAWNTRDPNVDEQTVWHDTIAKAAQALASDPSLNKEDVLDEIPIEVARVVFPKREQIIKAMGGLNYQDWTDNAEKVEQIAGRLREKEKPPEVAPPEQPPMPMEAPPEGLQPALSSSGPPEPTLVEPAAATPPAPSMAPPGPAPMTPPAPGGMPPMPAPMPGPAPAMPMSPGPGAPAPAPSMPI